MKKLTLDIDCGIEFCKTPDCECRFQVPQKDTMYCEAFYKPLETGQGMKKEYTKRLPECITACKGEESLEDKKLARIAKVERLLGDLPEWVRGTNRVALITGISQSAALNYAKRGIIKAHKGEDGVWEFWKDDVIKKARENMNRIVSYDFNYRYYR